MKKIFTLIVAIFALSDHSKAQSTAMDFTMDDCNGQMHNCFATLDSGNVIIMEFFMTCNMCISAGHEVEALKAQLETQYPGKIKFYQMGYTNSYSCSSVLNWVNSNGFSSVPFDSGAALVAYYGGFGMPTLAVVAGSSHEVLYTDIGYTAGDTSDMANSIHAFFNSTEVNELPSQVDVLSIFPNPSNDQFIFQINLNQPADVKVQLLTIKGEQVSTFTNETMHAGLVQKSFNTSSFAPGNYLVKTTVNGNSAIRKLTITH